MRYNDVAEYTVLILPIYLHVLINSIIQTVVKIPCRSRSRHQDSIVRYILFSPGSISVESSSPDWVSVASITPRSRASSLTISTLMVERNRTYSVIINLFKLKRGVILDILTITIIMEQLPPSIHLSTHQTLAITIVIPGSTEQYTLVDITKRHRVSILLT
jgi:hypothetical protein